jgi:hypothetical protein
MFENIKAIFKPNNKSLSAANKKAFVANEFLIEQEIPKGLEDREVFLVNCGKREYQGKKGYLLLPSIYKQRHQV